MAWNCYKRLTFKHWYFECNISILFHNNISDTGRYITPVFEILQLMIKRIKRNYIFYLGGISKFATTFKIETIWIIYLRQYCESFDKHRIHLLTSATLFDWGVKVLHSEWEKHHSHSIIDISLHSAVDRWEYVLHGQRDRTHIRKWQFPMKATLVLDSFPLK